MLVCVSKNIFNDLKKLKKFRLSTDFIPCTCNNMWLYTWLSKSTVFDETRKDCSLVCPPKEVPALESENECNLEMCPDKCSCKDRIVRCGGLNITNIPQYMSPLSKQLYLGN
ncbi:slit homolog 1 protein [Eurytemora carolleeae]|uniref:slit homolog 1 protein n=1 Tax=Eurytemora carolleeae TaxID=1294199 RepID=UPI000C77C4F5|nr:slit homolog 1 protein [Eurytemora carolleeae]|eukprot:XP_023330166.1 slit homolog 1 protein-like [Eurytemora affinis]